MTPAVDTLSLGHPFAAQAVDALDVALDLRGRRVVCVGGGPVTVRRVERLVVAGAQVRLVAPVVEPALAALAQAGTIDWVARHYEGPADISDAWFVHTATGTGVDATVARDSEAGRTFCVQASDAGQGSAQVLASRSVDSPAGPLRVAVHGGGDPRRAASVADQVAGELSSGVHDLRARRRRVGVGWVALVGGGPGDPGLLTRAGWEALRSADVVVVDRLAPREVLAELDPAVRVIEVGKAPGAHTMTQAQINDVMVREALAGWGVVRLKGGDPYVLGRGGEERLRLESEGVPVRVISGVTSSIAGPAAAGIPVTHRGLATGFSVVTGHDEVGDLPVRDDHTLVFLMGVSKLRTIVATLLAAGHSPETPTAIVERAHTSSQRTTVATLHELPEVAEQVGVENLAVIVVGRVVTVSPQWADR